MASITVSNPGPNVLRVRVVSKQLVMSGDGSDGSGPTRAISETDIAPGQSATISFASDDRVDIVEMGVDDPVDFGVSDGG